MPVPKTFAAGLTFLMLLGVSGALAQRAGAPPEDRKLDPDVTVVRLLLGVGDRAPQTWSGRVKLDRGELLGVEGYRFRAGDQVTGRDSWDAKSRLIRKAAPKKAQAVAKNAVGGPSTFGPEATPNGVLVSLKAPDDATLTVETDRGSFDVKLAEIASGRSQRYLDGKARAERVPAYAPLVTSPEQDDFPAAVSDGRGGAWVVYVVHKPRGTELSTSLTAAPEDFSAYAPKGGGDQIKLLHFENGRSGEAIDVTGEGLDVWRPDLAIDGQGALVVAWSENRDGNFDLYRRKYDPAARRWSDAKRLTTNPGADTAVALAAAPDGTVWMTWQAWINGKSDIFLNSVEKGAEGAESLGEEAGNDWSPALAVDPRGNIYVAFDTYAAGNYDVILRRRTPNGNGSPTSRVVVASTPRYEARPSLAVDPLGRVWVAYEERTPNWGKDAENLVTGKGTTLYSKSAVRVRCVDGTQVLDASDPLADAPDDLRPMNSFPRLAIDGRGRVWLAFRHRQEVVWGNNAVMVVGGVWVEHVTSLGGEKWAPPVVVPRSDGLLDNRPALVAKDEGPLLLVYNTDGRLHREVEMNPELSLKYYSHSGTPPGAYNNDLYVAAIKPPTGGALPATIRPATESDTPTTIVHPDETADTARMRNYRVMAGGKTYRLLRGEFHRHTEISQDGGSDGALEDMWRYAIDAGALDWIGNGDHDNGGGKEYTWWLVQKTTDLYNNPSFVPMFTYERSVAYPHGHRNVMFAKRGIRTLPRLVGERQVSDSDTKMLYEYLKALDGICASHTSATGMGTDWRDNDPAVEPFVEIFQGHRNSYEHFGAPRVARRPNEAIGGWRPLGMVWNALAMQYKLGFQASSDHISTHISYAVALAEEATRASVLDAFKKRHCYGATDNIVLDVRSGEHLMGDEFDAQGPVKLKVLVHGTRPIAKVDVIKDFVYVYSTEPNRAKVEFEWTDGESRGPGLSWYYVRAIQDDGELAWASPMWVRSRQATGQ